MLQYFNMFAVLTYSYDFINFNTQRQYFLKIIPNQTIYLFNEFKYISDKYDLLMILIIDDCILIKFILF